MKVAQSYPTLCDPMDYGVKSMEFSRPEYWSGWPFPSPGDLPNPGIEPRSPALQVDSLLTEIFFTKPLFLVLNHHFLRHRLYTQKENTWDRDEFFLVPWFSYIKKLCVGGHRDTADACLMQTCSQKSVRPQPPILGNWKNSFPNITSLGFIFSYSGTQWLCLCAGA